MVGSQLPAVGPVDFGGHYPPAAEARVGAVSAPVQLAASPIEQPRGFSSPAGSTRTVGAIPAKPPTLHGETGAAASQGVQTSRPRSLVTTAPGRLPTAAQTNSNVSMVLFDLQSGIRRAQALIQSVSTELSSAPSRMAAARAYSLELQAQQEISRLQMEGVGAPRQWYA